MATLHKSELIVQVATHLDTSKSQASKVIDAVTNSVGEEIAEQDGVTIVNFGSFKTRAVRERRVRAIGGESTGSLIDLPPVIVPG